MIIMLYYGDDLHIWIKHNPWHIYRITNREEKLKLGMNNYILVILEYYHKVQNLNNTFEISFCTRHLIMQFCIMLDNIK